MNNQREITLSHIDLYMQKVMIADNVGFKERYRNRVVGMLSLAKMLDIITPEEYESYFNKLYNY